MEQRYNSSLVFRAGLKPATSGFQVRRTNLSATLCGWFDSGANFLDPFTYCKILFSGRTFFFISSCNKLFFGSLREFLSPLICCMNFFWFNDRYFFSKSPTHSPESQMVCLNSAEHLEEAISPTIFKIAKCWEKASKRTFIPLRHIATIHSTSFMRLFP